VNKKKKQTVCGRKKARQFAPKDSALELAPRRGADLPKKVPRRELVGGGNPPEKLGLCKTSISLRAQVRRKHYQKGGCSTKVTRQRGVGARGSTEARRDAFSGIAHRKPELEGRAKKKSMGGKKSQRKKLFLNRAAHQS